MPLLIRGGLVLADADARPASADILVEGDRIVQVGPDLEAGPDATLLDARDRLVIPGFVNGHAHAHNHLAKGAIDRLPLEIWMQYLTARVLNRTPRDIYVGTAIGAIEMAKTGTTCACEMAQVSPWPTDETLGAVVHGYLDVGLRASIAPQVFDLPLLEGDPDLAHLVPGDLRKELERQAPYPRDEVLATLGRLIERWHGAGDGRIIVGLGPTIATRCSDGFLEACAGLSRDCGVPLQTHLEETKVGACAARELHGKSVTARLHDLGLLGPRTLLAHCIWVDAADLDLIAESGSSISHNPVSNLKIGSGIAPLLAMRERGCNVALGTDGSASSDNVNMFGALRLAAILQRVVDPNYDRWPSAADVFRMATTNGARAAGFGGHVGTIAPEQKADLVLLDLGATYFHPRNDLLNQLVYAEVGSSVTTVLVNGRVIVDEGRMTTVDEQALLAEADEIGHRVALEMEEPTALVRRLEPYLRRVHFDLNRADGPANRYASEAYRGLPVS
jgi:5-methylthioadenosine/S-adenosylhomocysteine deaminase